MTLAVRGQFYATLTIADKEIPLELGSFDHIIVVSNQALYLPQFRVSLYDAGNALEELAGMTDGTPVRLSVGRSQDDDEPPVDMNFRMFGPPRRLPDASRPVYLVAGLLDAMKYLRSAADKPYRGTSAEALRLLAQDCDLTPRVDATQDSMFWMPGRKTYCEFAAHIAEHGRAGPNSVMALAVDEKGQMLYRDLGALTRKEPVATFWQGEQPSERSQSKPVHVDHYQITSQSGLMNAITGYGAQVQQDTYAGGENFEADQATFPIFSGTVEMNREVRSEVGVVRAERAPPNVGNTHQYFTAAEYQNRRGRATLATKVTVICREVAPITLFDVVELAITNPGDSVITNSFRGKYVVFAKARFIQGTQYYEKYELATQGRQSDPTNSLVG